ncbi:hypothetical protein IscW_ISCW014369 [Ixodes scapularis]|uniref:Uncharacterized protein n=1 Tax=Ixodes scapularis TaxID=6945 RepID=B7QL48_IXOSC|nr:hypothetical protein IscW_ISCW014369 [Ixodes scapularis]|eukprot:XP_002415903.1 hypothetical protein IscW_ISCW014369 [Ixodes scapularis]
MRPSGWRLHLRLKRLARDGALLQQELAHRRQMYQTTKKPQYATLIGKLAHHSRLLSATLQRFSQGQ